MNRLPHAPAPAPQAPHADPATAAAQPPPHDGSQPKAAPDRSAARLQQEARQGSRAKTQAGAQSRSPHPPPDPAPPAATACSPHTAQAQAAAATRARCAAPHNNAQDRAAAPKATSRPRLCGAAAKAAHATGPPAQTDAPAAEPRGSAQTPPPPPPKAPPQAPPPQPPSQPAADAHPPHSGSPAAPPPRARQRPCAGSRAAKARPTALPPALPHQAPPPAEPPQECCRSTPPPLHSPLPADAETTAAAAHGKAGSRAAAPALPAAAAWPRPDQAAGQGSQPSAPQTAPGCRPPHQGSHACG